MKPAIKWIILPESVNTLSPSSSQQKLPLLVLWRQLHSFSLAFPILPLLFSFSDDGCLCDFFFHSPADFTYPHHSKEHDKEEVFELLFTFCPERDRKMKKQKTTFHPFLHPLGTVSLSSILILIRTHSEPWTDMFADTGRFICISANTKSLGTFHSGSKSLHTAQSTSHPSRMRLNTWHCSIWETFNAYRLLWPNIPTHTILSPLLEYIHLLWRIFINFYVQQMGRNTFIFVIVP